MLPKGEKGEGMKKEGIEGEGIDHVKKTWLWKDPQL